MFQTTIKHPVSCYGIGVHSGQTVQLTLKPAKADTGIVFLRTDITASENFIQASYLKVSETTLCTTITGDNGKFSISTIEHLLAAIWGSEVDNLIIEIDGPEVPIMDGSSKPFVFMLECAGIETLRAKKSYLKILKEVTIDNGKGAICSVAPSEKFSLKISIDFPSKAIGKQSLLYQDRNQFSNDIASARTFGFLEELDYLKEKGLAKGASLNNAIGIDKDQILNHDGLRYQDEFVRHKMLDAIGDFSLASNNIIGSFDCIKPGHSINNQLLRKILENSNNFSWISFEELKSHWKFFSKVQNTISSYLLE